MATYDQIQHDKKTVRCGQIGFGCNHSENDIVNCQDCLEEGELLEIIVPNESVFLDVKKDPNEMLFLNMSDAGAGNIFQKLKQAQKIAETQVREGMSTAIGEIIRLRKSHTKTKWQLEAKCTTLEKLAQAEETLRMAADKELQKVTNQKLCAEQIADEANRKSRRKCSDLERENARLQADLKKYKMLHAEEIERITEEKLRAEHIGAEADRQCALLNRENARLQQDLKATRLKFAYIDAQRRDFRLQLTTLRATLGLLSREPLPSPHIPVQPSRSGPNHIISGNGQSQDPQHAPTAGVFRSRAPTWVSISADKQDTADEVSPPNDDMSRPSNNDSPKPSNDDMPQPSKDDTPQPSKDDTPQPSNDDSPKPSNDDMPQSSMPQTSNEDVSKSTHEDGGSSRLDDNRVAGSTSDWDETYSDFEFSAISTVSDTDDGDDDGFDMYENNDDDAFELSDDEDEYSYEFDNETVVVL